jgi:hypothetical protein
MFKYKIKQGSGVGTVVDAVHLVEGNEEAILEFTKITDCPFIVVEALSLRVANGDEVFTAEEGDWLLKGNSAEFFSLSDEEFKLTYIPLDQPLPQEGPMEFTTFVRRPFVVEAVQVTTENIAEIAAHVGTLKNEGENPYIQVDRRLVPNVFKVHPGFWMTRMGDNIRCYSDHIFRAQFLEMTEELQAMVTTLSDAVMVAEI